MFYPDYTGTKPKKHQALLVFDRTDTDRLVARIGNTLQEHHGVDVVVDMSTRPILQGAENDKLKRTLRRIYSDATFAIVASDRPKVCRSCTTVNRILECGTPVLIGMDDSQLQTCEFPRQHAHYALDKWRLRVPYDYYELLALATRAVTQPHWIASYAGRALRFAQGQYQSHRRISCPRIRSGVSLASRQRSLSSLSPLSPASCY